MPVSVRCPSCEKVLKAPDAARGKGVKCPDCGTTVKVPAAKPAAKAKSDDEDDLAAAAGAGKPVKKKPVVAAKSTARAKSLEEDEGDFLRGVREDVIEDTRLVICPKCGKALDDDADECPKCGVDPETGQLTARRKRVIALAGAPDPDLYWKAAWHDSWEFLKNHTNLAVRTGMYWSLFTVLASICEVISSWCVKGPPIVFWKSLATLCWLGVSGWWWYLTIEVIRVSIAGKKELDRVDFDIVTNIALGVKSSVWTYVLLAPVIPFVGLATFVVPLLGSGLDMLWVGASMMSIILLVTWLIPVFVFPLAMIHMSMPYTYKAWIFYEMVKISLKNFAALAYWWLIAISMYLVFILGILLTVLLAGPDNVLALFVKLGEATYWLTEKIMGLIGEPYVAPVVPQPGAQVSSEEGPGLVQEVIKMSCWTLTLSVFWAPLSFLAAFPGIFLMRANGLLAYYFRPTLDLLLETTPNDPAPFWARFLAGMVDALLIGLGFVAIGGVWFFLHYLSGVFAMAYISFVGTLLACVAMNVFPMMYFTQGEKSDLQATIGKMALGLKVTNMKFERIQFKDALNRYMIKAIIIGGASVMLFFANKIPILILIIPVWLFGGAVVVLLESISSVFNPTHQAGHDLMSKTLVVWKGES